ncbi:MAG: asparagine synthase (glutamine-hydrolyzing) [Gammaproteobacteria bacterium]
MCGICGQYNFGDPRPVAPAMVHAMTESLIHRGPDDHGNFISGPLGLGFRRLSIIDLDGGHQPMSDSEKSVWVVFNGEIYNFPELRAELQGFGHAFRTRSDTEVIIHGYKQWGLDVFNHLHGMFGLAIWDEQRKRLILSRDAMGIKLVYYRVESGTVLFGSELRPILAALPQRPEIDMTALNLFLRYRYTPSPLTIYQGIRKLAPGTMAIFEDRSWRVERWYRTNPRHFSPAKSDAEAQQELLDIYKRALKRHLISDVPLGLLLSGGVDSGLLLGLMNLYGDAWPTYSIGYGKSTYKDDELADAGETARIFSAKHVSVELTRADFEQSLPRIVASLEEPIAASSIVPMYFVCQRARQDVKVVLMGQGPDELFAGYKRHLGVHYGGYWRTVPKWLRKGMELTVAKLPRNETLKRGVDSLGIENRARRYQQVFSIMPGDAVDGLFKHGVLPDGAGNRIGSLWSDLEAEMEGTDELGGFQILEIRSSLPDELLMYADKLSMAHGLEVRVPFLDREIVEYAEQLPASFKVRYGQRKWLHRKVAEGFLPTAILNRKKRGFAVNVVDDWFHDSLANSMDDRLLDRSSLMFEFMSPEAVQRLLEDHRSAKADNHKMLFSLVLFEEWLRANRSTSFPAAA